MPHALRARASTCSALLWVSMWFRALQLTNQAALFSIAGLVRHRDWGIHGIYCNDRVQPGMRVSKCHRSWRSRYLTDLESSSRNQPPLSQLASSLPLRNLEFKSRFRVYFHSDWKMRCALTSTFRLYLHWNNKSDWSTSRILESHLPALRIILWSMQTTMHFHVGLFTLATGHFSQWNLCY